MEKFEIINNRVVALLNRCEQMYVMVAKCGEPSIECEDNTVTAKNYHGEVLHALNNRTANIVIPIIENENNIFDMYPIDSVTEYDHIRNVIEKYCK